MNSDDDSLGTKFIPKMPPSGEETSANLKVQDIDYK